MSGGRCGGGGRQWPNLCLSSTDLRGIDVRTLRSEAEYYGVTPLGELGGVAGVVQRPDSSTPSSLPLPSPPLPFPSSEMADAV